jgi:hypothetical protein
MTKQAAIKKLMETMTEQEAHQTFNDSVNYFLRGTEKNFLAKEYATKLAIEEILEPTEITDEYVKQLDALYV